MNPNDERQRVLTAESRGTPIAPTRWSKEKPSFTNCCLLLLILMTLFKGKFAKYQSDLNRYAIKALGLQIFNIAACVSILFQPLPAAKLTIAKEIITFTYWTLGLSATLIAVFLYRRTKPTLYVWSIAMGFMEIAIILLIFYASFLIGNLMWTNFRLDTVPGIVIFTVTLANSLWTALLVGTLIQGISLLWDKPVKLIRAWMGRDNVTQCRLSQAVYIANTPVLGTLCAICHCLVLQAAVTLKCHPTLICHTNCVQRRLLSGFCCPLCSDRAQTVNVLAVGGYIHNLTCGIQVMFKWDNMSAFIWIEGRLFGYTMQHKFFEYVFAPTLRAVPRSRPQNSAGFIVSAIYATYKHWIYLRAASHRAMEAGIIQKYNMRTDQWSKLPPVKECSDFQVHLHSLYSISLNRDASTFRILIFKLDLLEEEQGWLPEARLSVENVPDNIFFTSAFRSSPNEILFIFPSNGPTLAYDISTKRQRNVGPIFRGPVLNTTRLPHNAIASGRSYDTNIYLPSTKECLTLELNDNL